MKIKLTKEIGTMGDEFSIWKIHLRGAIDSTACGLAYEEYDYEPSSKPLTCTTCITFLAWAKKVSKIKS